MKIEKPISIERSNDAEGIVWFKSADGTVAGSAYKKSGCGESQYNIQHVQKITPVEFQKAVITQTNDIVGEFSIVGQVVHIWDDGVFVIEAQGFDFWIDTEEYSSEVLNGEWFKVTVNEFTLYI